MVDKITRGQLIACWRDVSNAGGAVGFPIPPVTNEQVIPAIEALIGSLDPTLNRLLLATVDQALAGWLLLVGNADIVTAHWARVLRVQTTPEHRGTGVGRALMSEVERQPGTTSHLTICTWSFAVVWAWSVSMRTADGARSAGGQRHCVLARANCATRCSCTYPSRDVVGLAVGRTASQHDRSVHRPVKVSDR
jgi:GNAT superfamily N-acetyltransferase